jgi:cytochrome c553
MKPAELREIDRPWRIWASVIIVSILAFSVVFGFLVLPIVQGRAAGLDAFTAICRAVGILPGSPAVKQPTSEAKAQPTTQVAWSTDLMRTFGRRTQAGAEVAQGCVACHGEHGIAADPQNPNLAGQSAAQSGRPVGGGDLQAVARLQEWQPRARCDDGHCSGSRGSADRRGGHPLRLQREARP